MSRILRSTLIAISIALPLGACGDVNSVTAGPAFSVSSDELTPLVPRVIAPQLTDADIDWIPAANPQFNHHYVWVDPSQPSNDKLFVFMPGTGARPRGYQLIQQEAARIGYHVIGLMYKNNVAVVDVCTGSPDPDCSRNVRMEILDGVDRSALVEVNPANSIDNRLTKLLVYLDAQYPDEQWSRFLKDGTPKWSQIVVSGHSQGAGQAALIGTIRHVHRVVMFSGPPDARVPEEPDVWVSIGETPASKYFELLHQRDHLAPGILANARAFGLEKFGDPVATELGQPPYGGSHILVTDLAPQGGYGTPNPHRSSSLDMWTPVSADGTPLLRDAWRYLLGSLDGDHNDDQDEEESR